MWQLKKKISLLNGTRYRNWHKMCPVMCVLFTLYEIMWRKNLSWHDLEWVVLFVCLLRSLWAGLASPSFPWHSEKDLGTLRCDRKNQLGTRLLRGADPSQARMCHSFLPGCLRTTLSQQSLEVSPYCLVLKKIAVTSAQGKYRNAGIIRWPAPLPLLKWINTSPYLVI